MLHFCHANDNLIKSKILNEFNSEANRYGKKIKVLLLTEAGGEGITLLEVEHVHLLESSITPNKTIQAIGRAVRYKSHINLPKNRQIVNVWKYHSIKNEKFTRPKPVLNNFNDYYNYLIVNGMKKVNESQGAVDSDLDKIGGTKVGIFNDFYKILQKNSIENLNGNKIKQLNIQNTFIKQQKSIQLFYK